MTAPLLGIGDVATDPGLPSAVNAYVTAPLAVGVAVAVKRAAPLALPSTTAVGTVAAPSAVPMTAGADQAPIASKTRIVTICFTGCTCFVLWANDD